VLNTLGMIETYPLKRRIQPSAAPLCNICGPRWLWKVPHNGRVSLDWGTRGDIYPNVQVGPGSLDTYQEWKHDCMTNFPSACHWFAYLSALVDRIEQSSDHVWFQNLSCMSFSLGSYLVDPASSHMLVSKIKPCMS
jgi:hypothetical protein